MVSHRNDINGSFDRRKKMREGRKVAAAAVAMAAAMAAAMVAAMEAALATEAAVSKGVVAAAAGRVVGKDRKNLMK